MNVAFQEKTSNPKIGRVDYDFDEAWCGMCGRKKKATETFTSRKWQVRCRKCGRLVRANPHNKVKKQP
ncbi:hypothetical protein MUP77_21720 [Candidatus Bathyarchaeota archaeon]|nr:hypothetical protein [Candidatus Bathyarchaeota archaeon]